MLLKLGVWCCPLVTYYKYKFLSRMSKAEWGTIPFSFNSFFYKNLYFVCMVMTCSPSLPSSLSSHLPTNSTIHLLPRKGKTSHGESAHNPSSFSLTGLSAVLSCGSLHLLPPIANEGSMMKIRVGPYQSNKLPNEATEVWPWALLFVTWVAKFYLL